MRQAEFNGHKVELFDSIEELPVARFHKYNKMLMLEGGIGSGMEAVDRHLLRISAYIGRGDTANAQKEIDNARQSLRLTQEDLSPGSMAFAALVKSIDGKEEADISDDGLKRTAARLAEFTTVKAAETTMDSAKKKISAELELYFPGTFSCMDEGETTGLLQQRALLILGNIKGENNDAEIANIDTELVLWNKPETFTGTANAEIRQDLQFEEMALLLQSELAVDAKKLTVMEFYSASAYLQKRAKARAAAYKKK